MEHNPGAMLFLVDADPSERERVRNLLSEEGYAVIPLDSLAAARGLLEHKAVCHLLILSADALLDREAELDALLSLTSPAPPVIVSGFDPSGKHALHCLNRGACDFLASPFEDHEMLDAVAGALDGEFAGHGAKKDAIVASLPVSGWIELTSASQLEQLRRLQRFSDALFASSLPKDVCEDIKMAVEEVGRNAMEWGNRFNPDKQVHLSYCFFNDRIVIKCEDEGEGFKPQSVPDPTADPLKTLQQRQEAGKRPGGYGVYLIQKLVDEVVYNEKGNSVLMIKYLPEKN